MFKRKTALKTAAFLLSAAMMVSPAAVFAEEEHTDETFETVDNEAEKEAIESQKDARAAGNWKVYSGEIAPDLDDEELEIFADAHEAAGFYVEAYEPAAVLATQVVSGTNYAYLCRLIPAGDYDPAWKVAVVYKDLDGKCKMTSVRDLNLNDLAVKESEDSAGLLGAFEAAAEEGSEEGSAEEIPGEAGEALEAAFNGNDSLTAEALLGTEEAEDGNAQFFLYLCKGKLLPDDQSETLCLVEVRAEGNNTIENAVVTGIDVLDINAYVKDGPRTFITGNGALSIELPDFSWRSVEDSAHLAAFSDKANRVELSHIAVGEAFPPAQIASDNNAAVYQNYYSTPAEIFIYTGIVNQNDAGEMVKAMLQSVRILRYGFEPGEQSQAPQPSVTPGVSPTVTPGATPDDPRGTKTGAELTVYPEESNIGTLISEYTNGNWYDVNGGIYVPGAGIEKGYVWYDRTGNPRYLFAYPAGLAKTADNVNVVWPDGTEMTLISYTDGIWRDSRYVQYVYNGDDTWTGGDGSIVYGNGPYEDEINDPVDDGDDEYYYYDDDDYYEDDFDDAVDDDYFDDEDVYYDDVESLD